MRRIIGTALLLLLLCGGCLVEALEYSDYYSGDLLPAGTEFVEAGGGGGAQRHSQQFSKHGDKGTKGYESFHEQVRGEKGKLDKSNDSGFHEEESASEKNRHRDDGYYADSEKGFEITKGSKYYEEEKFAKGHSTKGSHDVHKSDEFKKNTEFFDEDEDSGYTEHHGGSSKEHSREKGGHDKSGGSQATHHSDGFGNEGQFKSGRHFKSNKGNEGAAGIERYRAFQSGFGEKGDQENNKHWQFSAQ